MGGLRWVIACAVGVVVSGCADPCLDDGVGQAEEPSSCAANEGTDGGSATVSGSASGSASVSQSGSASVTMSASGSATGTESDTETDSSTESATDTDTDTMTATDTDTTTATDTDPSETSGETTTHCDDGDMDGFGDPNACTEVPDGDPPPPGTVDNDLDCDDSDPATFPGAAEHEGDACMNDNDDDGWGDDMPPGGVDVGIDCNDDGDSPCAVIITQDGNDGDSYDQGLLGVLQGLGYAVTNIADTDAVSGDGDGFDVVVISESAQSTDIADTFLDSLAPVVCLEGLVWDDMAMSDEPQTSTSDDVAILDAMSALAGGLSGDVDVLDGPGRGLFFTSPPAAAQLVASVAGDDAQVVYFAFDEGDAMLAAASAPARRVGLGYDRDQQAGNNVTITADGLVLFEAAVMWASN